MYLPSQKRLTDNNASALGFNHLVQAHEPAHRQFEELPMTLHVQPTHPRVLRFQKLVDTTHTSTPPCEQGP